MKSVKYCDMESMEYLKRKKCINSVKYISKVISFLEKELIK